jgi:Fe-S-cluster-containing hydrogenase component 2
MGTFASLIARLTSRGENGTRERKGNAKGFLRVSPSCVSCSLCLKRCPLGIDPSAYAGGIVSDPDCIRCGACVVACPKKDIQ